MAEKTGKSVHGLRIQRQLKDGSNAELCEEKCI